MAEPSPSASATPSAAAEDGAGAAAPTAASGPGAAGSAPGGASAPGGSAAVPSPAAVELGAPIDLADFEPRALAYYTLGGELEAMPFNLSGLVLYYDKAAFTDAGLDPNKPPATLEEVRADSQKLLNRDASGRVTRTGIALSIDPWKFEQFLAGGGAFFAENGNGRQARAAAVAFDDTAGTQIMSWWQEMVSDGLATNVGTQGSRPFSPSSMGRAPWRLSRQHRCGRC